MLSLTRSSRCGALNAAVVAKSYVLAYLLSTCACIVVDSPHLDPFETLEEAEEAVQELQERYMAKLRAKGITVTAAQVRKVAWQCSLAMASLAVIAAGKRRPSRRWSR